jgi:hypothetical protein
MELHGPGAARTRSTLEGLGFQLVERIQHNVVYRMPGQAGRE